MLPERTPAQRVQDDEDHRLALCGLTPDERSGEELEDFNSRHYDFDSHRSVTNGFARAMHGGELYATRHSPPTIFASGLPRPTPHDAKQGPGGVGRSAIPASGVATSLGPAPLSTT